MCLVGYPEKFYLKLVPCPSLPRDQVEQDGMETVVHCVPLLIFLLENITCHILLYFDLQLEVPKQS